ncbi:MAG: anti-sigma factor [Chitinophagaceae bacterium]|nr:anti-sigma factor [Chitinophagaceae bacterium]
MGLLPDDEARKIEQLAAIFPEVRQEINSISETLEKTALSFTAEPSPAVKENLMKKIKRLKTGDAEDGSNVFEINAAKEGSNKSQKTKILSFRTTSVVAASVAALLLFGSVIAYLIMQNRNTVADVASLKHRVNNLSKSLNQQQEQNQAYAEMLAMLSSDYKKINLTAVHGKPAASVQVFWSPKSKDVFIANISLPPPPSGRQYQLWAIVDGQPVDAGMLKDIHQPAQKMKSFAKADAFAITLEKKGGSATPTLEAMYVMGKTS